MRILGGFVVIGGLMCWASFATAQRPGGGDASASKSEDIDDLVSRMMAFDKDKDGKLTKSEITDERLLHVFDRADADKDGNVTKDELTALGAKEYKDGGGFGPPGGGPPGGFGPGGPGGPMMMPRPGEILPQMLQQRLNLSPEQKTQVDALQKEVDSKLEKILTEDQRKQLKEMRSRGPGGFGPPGPGGRRGGPPGGGPGGGPPGGEGRPPGEPR